MTSVSRTFDVAPQPEVVVSYLADFSHAEQWDPGTERCVRNDDGPVRVGSSCTTRRRSPVSAPS